MQSQPTKLSMTTRVMITAVNHVWRKNFRCTDEPPTVNLRGVDHVQGRQADKTITAVKNCLQRMGLFTAVNGSVNGSPNSNGTTTVLISVDEAV